MARRLWKSPTCEACRKRKVRCDKSEYCGQCRKGGRRCERPHLICSDLGRRRSSQETQERCTFGNLYTQSSRNDGHMICAHVKDRHRNSRDRIMAVELAMDSRKVPNLSRQSWDVQERDIFRLFVMENFPGLYACYAPRMDVTWLEFVLEPTEPPPAFLRWAIRCISTLYLGQNNQGMYIINKSREQYCQALAFAQQVPAEKKTSDNTFAAILLLALHEMKDEIFSGSWLSHADGIAAIMISNGPAAYSSGFGRTLFLTFRPFLITAALLRNQSCFLEGEEWVSMVESTTRSEHWKGTGSCFGMLVESAFNEVVKAPGLIARTKAPSCYDTTLVADIMRWRTGIESLRKQLINVHLSLHDPSRDLLPLADHLGPIPPDTARTATQLSIDAIQSIAELVQNVQGGQLFAAQQVVVDQFIDSYVPDRISGPAMFQHQVLAQAGWLDRCALSMGVLPSLAPLPTGERVQDLFDTFEDE